MLDYLPIGLFGSVMGVTGLSVVWRISQMRLARRLDAARDRRHRLDMLAVLLGPLRNLAGFCSFRILCIRAALGSGSSDGTSNPLLRS